MDSWVEALAGSDGVIFPLSGRLALGNGRRYLSNNTPSARHDNWTRQIERYPAPFLHLIYAASASVVVVVTALVA